MMDLAVNPVKQDRRPAPGRPSLPPLRLMRSYEEAVRTMEQWVRSRDKGPLLRILEAGCGTKWPLNLDGIEYTLTGVDVDERALEVRRNSARANDELMHGDLRARDLFGSGQFDVIYNSFVLEHVDGAAQVLDNFLSWLKPGGILILRIPDRDSVYGFLTRISPFWFHVFFKKYVQKLPNAGKPGYDPFPTFYDRVVSRRGMHDYCRNHGCVVRDEASSASYLPSQTWLHPAARLLVRSVSALSLGKLQWRYNNLTLLIEKPHALS